MIHINVQSKEILLLNRAVANAVNQIRQRSFAGRHSELGKMINCWVCKTRHRSSIKCEATYSSTVSETRKGTLGAAMFAKKRHNPHGKGKKDLKGK